VGFLIADKPLCKQNWGLGRSPKQVCVRLLVLHRAKPMCERYQASLLGRRGAPLSALRLIIKSSAFEPPIFSPLSLGERGVGG